MKHTIACFGETLWDFLPSGKVPGGAPMNVALHLRQLGMNASLISRVGNDSLGEALLEYLESRKMPTGWIQMDPVYPTGSVKVILGVGNDVSYDIVQPVAWDYIRYSRDADRLVSESDLFVFGSLAARNESSRETLLRFLGSAKRKVFDVNLRPPHFSRSILEKLLAEASIVKMNHEELALISGWFNTQSDEKAQMEYLRDRFELEMICVTKGANGAALLEGDRMCVHPGYSVRPVDTVGSGDSFLAALLKRGLTDGSFEKALEYACAMGALVATHPGANPEIKESDLFKLMHSKEDL
jgi:fructokinase